MARLIRLAGLMVLILAAVFLVGASALWLGLRTDYGQQVLRRQLVGILQSSIAADIHVGQVGGVPGRSFEIQNLRIAIRGRTVVRLPRVGVEYAPLELLSGRIFLRRVTFERPWVRVVREDGRWGLPRLVEGNGSGLALPVHIRRLEILGGRLAAAWQEAGSWRRIAATDLHLESSAIQEEETQELRVARLAFVPRGVAVSPVRASGTAAREGSRSICVVDTQLATNRSQLALSGCIDPADAVTARLTLDPLDAGEARAVFPWSGLQTNVTVTAAARGPWHATRLALNADLGGGGALNGRATLDLESKPARYRGSMDFARLNPQAAFSRGVPVSLSGRGRFRGSGRGDDASVQWRLRLKPSEVAGQPVESLRVAGKSARVEHTFAGRVEGRAGAARVRGRVSVTPVLSYELASRVGLKQLDTILPGLPGRGTGAFSLVGRGTEPDDREADLRGTITAAVLKGVVVDRARLQAKLDGDRLSIENLSVEGPGLGGKLWGNLYLPTGTVDLDLDATVALRRLRAALDWPLAGELGAEAAVRGSLGALEVDGSLSGTDLGWRATRAQQATVNLDGSGIGGREPAVSARVSIEELRVAGGEPRTASGEVGWARTAQGEETATVSAVAWVGSRTTERIELHVMRAVDKEIRGEIRELSLTPLGDDAWRLAEPASFVVRDGLSTDSIILEAEGQKINLGGRLSLDGENDASLSLGRINLAPICVALGLPECSGRVSAEATVTGTAAAPLARGTGSAAGLRVGPVDYGRLDFEAFYRDRLMSIDAELRTPVAGKLDLDAAVPMDLRWAGSRQDVGREPLKGRIHAEELDLAFLPVVLPREVSEARGSIGVDLRLAGTRAAPDAEGWMQLEGGFLEIARLGCPYADVGARLEVKGSRVDVPYLRATSGNGTLGGSGWVEIDDGESGPRVSFTLLMENFLALRNRQYEAAMTGDLRLAGSTEAPQITGSLAVTRATLRLPQFMPSTDPRALPDPTIEVVGVADGQAPAEPGPTGLNGPVRVVLEVRADGNAWIRREDMNVEIGGELRIEREPYQEPSMNGRLTLRRGWYAFEGRRFNVREGTITFLGKGTEPQIDVTGSYRAGEYTVFVHVTGSGSKPSLDLSSEPPLDEADILAVLLFGKPSGQLTGGQAASLQERTVALAGGYAIGELSGSVRDALGLDTLDVEVPGGAGGQGSVTVGRYVTKDVFVSFAQEFGASVAEVVSLEYSITPKISIRGSTSSLGNSTIDVLVSHRY